MLKLLAGQLTSGLEQQAWRRLREDDRGFKDAVLCCLKHYSSLDTTLNTTARA